MAAGGMYDVLGGGFHRYSVDEAWLVPHFEKMLYDNALLAPTYLHAWLVTGTSGTGGWRRRRSTTWSATSGYRKEASPRRRTRTPTGSRASPTSGTAEELEEALGEPHPEWLQPFEHGRFVIRGEVPEDARRRLLEVRAARPQPFRDDKAITAWNGMALAAFAEAAHRLERPDYLEVALDLARFLGETVADGEAAFAPTATASPRSTGIEDYAHVANGYVELHWATGDPRWLEEAYRLAQRAQAFADPEHGGWFVGDHDLVARRKEFDDHPTPSGNSMMAFVALRLARIWGDEGLERAAVGAFRLARPLLERAPTALGHMLCALDLHFSTPRKWRSSASPRSFAARRFRASSRTRSSPLHRSRPTPSRSSRAGPQRRQPGRLRLRTLRLPGARDEPRRAPRRLDRWRLPGRSGHVHELRRDLLRLDLPGPDVLRPVAGDDVVGREAAERRLLVLAARRLHVWAARVEPARGGGSPLGRSPARRIVSRSRSTTGQGSAPPRGARSCTGGAVRRARGGRGDLDDLAEVHDRDPVGDVADDREVVGDEDT